jgi:hypothetical protein
LGATDSVVYFDPALYSSANQDGDMDGSSAENQAPHSKTAVVDTLSMESMPVAAILHHLSLSLSLSPNLPLALSTESA